MGARSITVVKDKDDNKIIEMYRQHDGCPEGMGKQLKQFIESGKLVNGIPVGENKKLFNGIECFVAQLVSHFKEKSGDIYLHSPTTDYKHKSKYAKLYGAEYYYEIKLAGIGIRLTCWDTYENDECFTWVDIEQSE